ncbi:MAG: NADH-quinone oxidoreductase subunit L [Cystobacterineae bacterium]|nr:NADH-quinone oxidoreductase subunit L [Cystobacterineae bacterium]
MEKLFPEYPFPLQTLENGLWLIIALPLLGAFINGVFGKALSRKSVHWVACASVGGSFLLSLLVIWALGSASAFVPNPFSSDTARYALSADYGTWFSAGGFKVNFGLLADRLSASMLLVITGVGFLIHLYSTSYMEHDKGYAKYFCFLNLFVAMMLTLVLADSLVLLFVGWEGVGLCSYLLIGFWYDDNAKAWAGRKAFITNRIGDFGFLVASFLLVLLVAAAVKEAPQGTPATSYRFSVGLHEKGPLAFQSLSALATTLVAQDSSLEPSENVPPLFIHRHIETGPLKGYSYAGVMTVVLLFFLLGAAGKSAQLPLYVWLPDAMAGPTPVSALIHAATMVTAGVYLFCRISYLVVLSPFAMATIAVVGCLTALIAALIAFAQDDIKKILAYSTVSQLGFMFMGIGCGLFWAAFLHVVTHAFFKACMFLGAGSVMHGNGDETNIKRLGGLRKEMPWTAWTFLIGTLAITGIVPLSGFFSKDAILFGLETQQLADVHVLHTLYYLGLVAAACTAFYMVRLYVLTFEGQRSPLAKLPHAHESAWPMTLPLGVLAVLSIVAILHGFPYLLPAPNASPNQTLMEFYLTPVFGLANRIGFHAQTLLGNGLDKASWESLLWTGWLKAWLIALASGGISAFLYLKLWRGERKFPAILEPLRRFAQNKFFVDELYELLFIERAKGLAKGLYRYIDAFLVDRVAVHGTAQTVGFVGKVLCWFQNGNVQAYASAIALALAVGLTYALLQVLS